MAQVVRETEQSDRGLLEGHSPGQERALGGYAVLLGAFGGLASGFAAWPRGSGRELPELVPRDEDRVTGKLTRSHLRPLRPDGPLPATFSPFRLRFTIDLSRQPASASD
jgi:hypothetical protein